MGWCVKSRFIYCFKEEPNLTSRSNWDENIKFSVFDLRFLAESNRRKRFCGPLTKPLIQGTESPGAKRVDGKKIKIAVLPAYSKQKPIELNAKLFLSF